MGAMLGRVWGVVHAWVVLAALLVAASVSAAPRERGTGASVTPEAERREERAEIATAYFDDVTVVRQPRWVATMPLVGRVVVNGVVLVAPDRGDLFGYAACAVDDVDGDGVADVAVAAPLAGLRTELVGRVYVHSGADGRLLMEVASSAAELDERRFGTGLVLLGDADGDGARELGVRCETARRAEMEVVSVARGVTLEVRGDRVRWDRAAWSIAPDPADASGDGMRGALVSDVDADGTVGTADLVRVVRAMGRTAATQGPQAARRGFMHEDMNADDVVDGRDLAVVLAEFGKEWVEVAAGDTSRCRPDGQTVGPTFGDCFEVCCYDDGDGNGDDKNPKGPGGSGCPPTDVDCDGIDDGEECPGDSDCDGIPDGDDPCNLYVNISVDSNNDRIINTDDDEVEDDLPGQLFIVNGDDDNQNDVSDHEEEPSAHFRDDELTVVRCRGMGGTGSRSWSLEFSSTVRVYRSREREDPIESSLTYPGSVPSSFYVESLLPGLAAVSLTVTTGSCISTDQCMLTALEVELDDAGDVSTDLELFTAAVLLGPDELVDEDTIHDLIEFLPVQVRFQGTTETHDLELEDGVAACTFLLNGVHPHNPPAGGHRLFAFVLGAEYVGEQFDVEAGDAASVTLSEVPNVVRADGTGNLILVSAVKDSRGYYVEPESTAHLVVSDSVCDHHTSSGPFPPGVYRNAVPHPSVAAQTPRLLNFYAGRAHATAQQFVEPIHAQISSSHQYLDIATGDEAVITVQTNAEDGTPVAWLVGNGTGIIPEAATFVSNGTAQIRVSAARVQHSATWIGQCPVVARIADRVVWLTLTFVDSSALTIELDHRTICPDPEGDGQIEILWGGSPIIPNHDFVIQEEVRGYSIVSRTNVRVRGTPGAAFQIDVPPALEAHLVFEDLSDNRRGLLDKTGLAFFGIRAANGPLPEPKLVTLTLSQLNDQGGISASTYATLVVSDATFFTYAFDAVLGFLGQDTETYAGLAANIAGSVVMVSDIGSLAKNVYRMSGLSPESPDYIETVLSSLSLAPVIGKPAGAVRALIKVAGDGPFAQALAEGVVKALRGDFTQLNESAGLAMCIARGGISVDACKQVLTSPALIKANNRVFDEVSDELAEAITKQLTDLAQHPEFGIEAYQRVLGVLGHADLGDEFFQALGRLSVDNAKTVTEGLAYAIHKGGVEEGKLVKLLNSRAVFAQTFDEVQLAKDLKRFSSLPNLNGIVGRLGSLSDITRVGTRYEIVSARTIIESGALGRSVTEVKALEGTIKTSLGKTDLDLLCKLDDGSWLFVQAKLGGGSISKAEAKLWIAKVKKYAEANGIEPFTIRYVCPDPENVPPAVFDYIKDTVAPGQLSGFLPAIAAP